MQADEIPEYPKFHIDGYEGKMSVCTKEYIAEHANLSPIQLLDLSVIVNEGRNSSTSSSRDRLVFLVRFKNGETGRKQYWVNSIDVFQDLALPRLNSLRQSYHLKAEEGDARSRRKCALLDEYLQTRNISNAEALNTILKANSILAKGAGVLEEKVASTIPNTHRSKIEPDNTCFGVGDRLSIHTDLRTKVTEFTEHTFKTHIKQLQSLLGDTKSVDRVVFLTGLEQLVTKTEGLIKDLHKKSRV